MQTAVLSSRDSPPSSFIPNHTAEHSGTGGQGCSQLRTQGELLDLLDRLQNMDASSTMPGDGSYRRNSAATRMVTLLSALAATPVTVVDRVNRAWVPIIIEFLSAMSPGRRVMNGGDEVTAEEAVCLGGESKARVKVARGGKALRAVLKGWLEVLVRLKDAGNYYR
jgi:hypothetical protein